MNDVTRFSNSAGLELAVHVQVVQDVAELLVVGQAIPHSVLEELFVVVQQLLAIRDQLHSVHCLKHAACLSLQLVTAHQLEEAILSEGPLDCRHHVRGSECLDAFGHEGRHVRLEGAHGQAWLPQCWVWCRHSLQVQVVEAVQMVTESR